MKRHHRTTGVTLLFASNLIIGWVIIANQIVWFFFNFISLFIGTSNQLSFSFIYIIYKFSRVHFIGRLVISLLKSNLQITHGLFVFNQLNKKINIMSKSVIGNTEVIKEHSKRFVCVHLVAYAVIVKKMSQVFVCLFTWNRWKYFKKRLGD